MLKASQNILTGGLLFLVCFVIGIFSLQQKKIEEAKARSALEAIMLTGELRVLTRNSPTTYFEDRGGESGFEYELAQAFAEFLGVELKLIVENNLQAMQDQLKADKADLIAAGFTVTPKRAEHFHFGPAYQKVTEELVFLQGNPWPNDLGNLQGDLKVIAGSSHAATLLDLKHTYPSLFWEETDLLSSEELILAVADGNLFYTIADSNELAMNQRFYPKLLSGKTLTDAEPLAWVFQKRGNDKSLLMKADAFFKNIEASGLLSELIDKYYGNLEAIEPFDTKRFIEDAEAVLPLYKDLFIEAGKKHNIDWRYLAALSYQESHWKKDARSKTGVKGLMMLTRRTAKEIGIKDRTDPKDSITGGARYLRKLIDRLPSTIIDAEKVWIAMAGYNIGPGHVSDLIKLVQNQSLTRDVTWLKIKTYLPYLHQKKWYSKLKHGYGNGRGALHYVSRIQRYYDLLVWLDDNAVEINDDETNRRELNLSDATSTAETASTKSNNVKTSQPNSLTSNQSQILEDS